MNKETSTFQETTLGAILKTDALGRVTVGRAQREAILDAFEASGMTGQAFALHHGIKIQTFASWIQKRRHARGDYKNEALRRKLRVRIEPPQTLTKNVADHQPIMNLLEVSLKNEPPQQYESLEVTLPGGAVVRISHESQIGLLKMLIHQLSC